MQGVINICVFAGSGMSSLNLVSDVTSSRLDQRIGEAVLPISNLASIAKNFQLDLKLNGAINGIVKFTAFVV